MTYELGSLESEGGREAPSGQLSLRLLTSPALLRIVDALPRQNDPWMDEDDMLPASLNPAISNVIERLDELEGLGLIERRGKRLRRSRAGEEFLTVRNLLDQWTWGDQPGRSGIGTDLPDISSLANMLNQLWKGRLLIRLALNPAGATELSESLPETSLSTVKRYLQKARDMGLVEKRRTPSGRLGYHLTHRACLLVRPFSAALRLEQLYLSENAAPPSEEVIAAGLAVAAQLIRPKQLDEREVLLLVQTPGGNPLVSRRAIYRDGRLVTSMPAGDSHDSPGTPTIAGSVDGWFSLFIERDVGQMTARYPGSKGLLRQLRGNLRF